MNLGSPGWSQTYDPLMEHSPRMELCESSECEKTRVLSPRFLQNTELFLECVFVLLPGVSETVSSLQLWLFIRLYGQTCLCHLWLAPVIEHLTHVILLNPQECAFSDTE